jgi:hypothetical protein
MQQTAMQLKLVSSTIVLNQLVEISTPTINKDVRELLNVSKCLPQPWGQAQTKTVTKKRFKDQHTIDPRQRSQPTTMTSINHKVKTTMRFEPRIVRSIERFPDRQN